MRELAPQSSKEIVKVHELALKIVRAAIQQDQSNRLSKVMKTVKEAGKDQSQESISNHTLKEDSNQISLAVEVEYPQFPNPPKPPSFSTKSQSNSTCISQRKRKRPTLVVNLLVLAILANLLLLLILRAFQNMEGRSSTLKSLCLLEQNHERKLLSSLPLFMLPQRERLWMLLKQSPTSPLPHSLNLKTEIVKLNNLLKLLLRLIFSQHRLLILIQIVMVTIQMYAATQLKKEKTLHKTYTAVVALLPSLLIPALFVLLYQLITLTLTII